MKHFVNTYQALYNKLNDIQKELNELKNSIISMPRDSTLEVEVEVDSRTGLNKNIKFSCLSNKQMKKAGFTFNEEYKVWDKVINIKFPQIPYYTDLEISLLISVSADNEALNNIQVIDDEFGQPYDYQYMLMKDPTFLLGLIVQQQVEIEMHKLVRYGIISGWNEGDYI